MIISSDYWTKRFGRSPSVVGKVIAINSKPFTIIGVNPQDFTGLKNAHSSPELFVPFSTQPLILPRPGSVLTDSGSWWMQIMARSKAGVPDQTAQAALDTAFQAAVRAFAHPKKDEAIPHLKVGRWQPRHELDRARAGAAALRASAALLFAVALLAGWVPARRASRIQPMQALRHE